MSQSTLYLYAAFAALFLVLTYVLYFVVWKKKKEIKKAQDAVVAMSCLSTINALMILTKSNPDSSYFSEDTVHRFRFGNTLESSKHWQLFPATKADLESMYNKGQLEKTVRSSVSSYEVTLYRFIEYPRLRLIA
jgi:hypothetical protein